MGSALRAAASHPGRIRPWAVASATVSILLQASQQRAGAAGRGVAGLAGVSGLAGLAGLAGSLITILVIPVIAIEGLGANAAIQRSSSLFKQTWGESVAARVGFALLGFLLALPAVLLVFVGFATRTIGAGIAIKVVVVWVLAVTLVMASLRSIFQTALHLYAAEHEGPAVTSSRIRSGKRPVLRASPSVTDGHRYPASTLRERQRPLTRQADQGTRTQQRRGRESNP